MIGLRGKRALITGGSRGIGAAAAELFAEHGADVAIGYRSRHADADALATDLRTRFGVKVVAHAADISTRAGADELVDRAATALGGLDFFVGNAGIWPADNVAFADMTDEQWNRTMSENVHSVFWT